LVRQVSATGRLMKDLLMNIVYFITGIATKQARYET